MANFKDSFAAARKAGKKVFTWNGKSYTTELASEKKAPTKSPRPTSKPGLKDSATTNPRRPVAKPTKPVAKPAGPLGAIAAGKGRTRDATVKEKVGAAGGTAPTSSPRPPRARTPGMEVRARAVMKSRKAQEDYKKRVTPAGGKKK